MPAHDLARRLRVARGLELADLVIKGGQVLDVLGGGLCQTDIAVVNSIIAGLGDYGGREELDATGRIVLPGFIEGHLHIESSMLTPRQFGWAAVAHGTTTVIADPHEICNVAGLEGMRYMLQDARGALADILYMAPSCVPASALETSGAELGPRDLAEIMAWEGVLGLGEVMNFPAVLSGDEVTLEKLQAAKGRVIDGHAPGLRGAELQAYMAAGPDSDHECTTLAEAREKLAAGMWIMIREGSAARNLRDLFPLFSHPAARRCLLVSDDVSAQRLEDQGHLDHALRLAVELGVSPLDAVRAVTLAPATRFRLHDRGALLPGLRADMVIVGDLRGFEVSLVVKDGKVVARDGVALAHQPPSAPCLAPSCHLPPLSPQALAVPAPPYSASTARARIIGLVPDQILTQALVEPLPVRDGCLTADLSRDILKLVVIERHGRRGSVGVGFVKGLGLREGALASTVAHDSHNMIVVGLRDEDIVEAAQALARMGGGQLAWRAGTSPVALPLPVGGLMSDEDPAQVAAAHKRLCAAAHQLGCTAPDPFIQLSFLALPVIPELKLTDLGLVDVAHMSLVPVAL